MIQMPKDQYLLDKLNVRGINCGIPACQNGIYGKVEFSNFWKMFLISCVIIPVFMKLQNLSIKLHLTNAINYILQINFANFFRCLKYCDIKAILRFIVQISHVLNILKSVLNFILKKYASMRN